MNRDEKDIARRWCIFNCWGWPKDLPMPDSQAERRRVAKEQMAKCVRAIGITKCLEYWNGEEFAAFKEHQPIAQVYGRDEAHVAATSNA